MLYIARHGETDWNRQKRFQARNDIPLNATGRRQAEALRELFRERGVGFTRALSSPLGRAVETCAIVLDGSPISCSVEPSLIELSLGDYEGRLEADLHREQGEAFECWRARHFLDPAPNGESLLDGMTRVTPLLDALRPEAVEHDLLLIGHQGINMAIKAALSGCTDAVEVAGYKQANDEVDVWDVTVPRCVERLRVRTG